MIIATILLLTLSYPSIVLQEPLPLKLLSVCEKLLQAWCTPSFLHDAYVLAQVLKEALGSDTWEIQMVKQG